MLKPFLFGKKYICSQRRAFIMFYEILLYVLKDLKRLLKDPMPHTSTFKCMYMYFFIFHKDVETFHT